MKVCTYTMCRYCRRADITVDWSKLEIVLYSLFLLSCPAKLTGLYRTVSTCAPCFSKFTLLIWTKMAWPALVGPGHQVQAGWASKSGDSVQSTIIIIKGLHNLQKHIMQLQRRPKTPQFSTSHGESECVSFLSFVSL